MEFELLTLDSLNEIINNLITASNNEYGNLSTAVAAMHQAGLRSIEACYIDKHKILTDHAVGIWQPKTEDFRVVETQYLGIDFIEAIRNSEHVKTLCTERQLRYFVRRNFGNFELWIDNKPITTHIFRYAFIRNIFAQTESIEFVQNIIGHADRKVTESYIFNDIVKVF